MVGEFAERFAPFRTALGLALQGVKCTFEDFPEDPTVFVC